MGSDAKAIAEQNVNDHIARLKRNTGWPSADECRAVLRAYDVINLLDEHFVRQAGRRILLAEIRNRKFMEGVAA